MTWISLCVFVFCIYQSSASEYYYWREYTGVVPSDALPGGKDADGQDTYIGQAYIHNHGLYVAQIYPGVAEVDVPCYGVKTAPINIKILCTDSPELFTWVKTSAKTFAEDTKNLKVFIGAYDNIGNNGIMHVGRIYYQGLVTVGDVTPFKSRIGNVQLFFPFKKVERAVNFYELLIYTAFDIDPRIGSNTLNVTAM